MLFTGQSDEHLLLHGNFFSEMFKIYKLTLRTLWLVSTVFAAGYGKTI